MWGPDTELKSFFRSLGSIRWNCKLIRQDFFHLAPLVVLVVQRLQFAVPLTGCGSTPAITRIWGTHAASAKPLVVMICDIHTGSHRPIVVEMIIDSLVLVKFVRFPDHFLDPWHVEHFLSVTHFVLSSDPSPTGKPAGKQIYMTLNPPGWGLMGICSLVVVLSLIRTHSLTFC